MACSRPSSSHSARRGLAARVGLDGNRHRAARCGECSDRAALAAYRRGPTVAAGSGSKVRCIHIAMVCVMPRFFNSDKATDVLRNGVGRMAKRHKQASSGDSRDDADARGEHVYGAERAGRKVPADPPELVRQPGHYAAGADGTQDVREPIRERPISRPSSSSHSRRPRKIR